MTKIKNKINQTFAEAFKEYRKSLILNKWILISGIFSISITSLIAVFAQDKVLDILKDFIPLSIEIELAIAGLSIAILLLIITFQQKDIEETGMSKPKIYQMLVFLPRWIIVVCITACGYTALVYLALIAGFKHDMLVNLMLFLTIFFLLTVVFEFSALVEDIAVYGLKRIAGKKDPEGET